MTKPLTPQERKRLQEIYMEAKLQPIADRKVLKKRRRKEVE